MQRDQFRAKIREQDPEAEAAAMTSIVRETFQRGQEQGRAEERAAMLTKLLSRKFGALTPEQQTRIAQASPEVLERWVERLLAADSLDDVFEE